MKILLLFLVSACSPDAEYCDHSVASDLAPFSTQKFVAHAGGSPLGLRQTPPYTNSHEAFAVSYANGFRAFEFDLITLGDGTIVAAHDYHESHFGLRKSFRDINRAELGLRRYDNRYRPIFAAELIDLMETHPDVWIILDTKWDHLQIAARLVEMAPDDSVRDRLVPHVGSASHAQALRELYPFPQLLMAMYRWPGADSTIISRAETYGINNVMMWWDRRWSEATQTQLEAAGLQVWVHTPHEPTSIAGFIERGVWVYSDGHIEPCAE